MALFSRIKNLFAKDTTPVANKTLPPEVEKLYALESDFSRLLNENAYIARRDYSQITDEFSKLQNHFKVLMDGGILEEYCRKHGVPREKTIKALGTLVRADYLIEEHNDRFVAHNKIAEKQYLDAILREVDPQIMLDENQRDVVLTDEDYCLVIAGAGAGKTTTVAAKVKYLVDKKKIDPKQILVISFTNKAVEELRDKINKALQIDCPITTFHSTGNAIIRKNTPDKLNIVDGSRLYYVLMDYFRGNLLKNERMVNNLILFFGSYIDAPYEGKDLNLFFDSVAKGRYETLKSDLDEYIHEISDTRSKKQITISNEILRSGQEVEIANFLYLNNIDYQYEPIYPFNIQFSRKPYTPDFIIRQGDHTAYIEHFALSESGENHRFSPDQIEAYKRAIREKIRLHKQHGTSLLYTFSRYKDGRPLLDHLKEQLEHHGFILDPRSQREVVEKLVFSEQSRYIRRLVDLICQFINNFKTNAYTNEDFRRLADSTTNVRSKLFLDICQGCYLEYQRHLAENNAVDFQDMINESARLLREVKGMKQKLDFRYIIVDEYQDISRQRFDLTRELSEVTDAKIIAVGDDWQSIYAFSGSDISLFTHFREKMGYGKLLKIVNTYRNAQEVIDIAGNFIQKNESQIRKELVSPKRIKDPVIIYTYDSRGKGKPGNTRSGALYAMAHGVEVAIEQILKFNKAEGKSSNSNILLLGRFNFDGDSLERSGLFEYVIRGSKIRSVKYPKVDITFMTAHSSKGLGYDNVIVINGRNETYGFPSKIENDPVLNFVIKEDRSIQYAEERRLFYVAMTRTKNRVFFIAPEQNPSEFLLEIKRDYKSVLLQGNWNETEPGRRNRKTCPICGYPLQYRYKSAYGLRLYICTNEPEVCGFLSNDLMGEKMAIQKCDQCTDGYLIVKRSSNGSGKPFLGCTNYTRDGKGCGNTIPMQEYYLKYGLKEEKKDEVEREKKPAGSQVQQQKTTILEHGPALTATLGKKKTDHFILSDHEDSIEGLDLVQMNGSFLLEIIGKILHCIDEISEIHFFGKEVLLNVLRGSPDEAIQKYKLETASEYGTLSSIEREHLDLIIEWLIDKEFLLRRNKLYPVLYPTYNGKHFLQVITNAHQKDLAKSLVEHFPKLTFTLLQNNSGKKKDYPVYAGAPWTEAEDRKLQEELDIGLTISEIARNHNRSYGVIKARIEKLDGCD